MENLEYILPQDLKMWAKSAGRKFLEAEEKITNPCQRCGRFDRGNRSGLSG